MARPSPRDFLRNFDDYDGSLEKKVRKALTNSAKKLVTFSDCCGHPGEPGCWKKGPSPGPGGHGHSHDHHHHDRPAEAELVELKARLAELTAAVDGLLARQEAENQRADDGPADPLTPSP